VAVLNTHYRKVDFKRAKPRGRSGGTSELSRSEPLARIAYEVQRWRTKYILARRYAVGARVRPAMSSADLEKRFPYPPLPSGPAFNIEMTTGRGGQIAAARSTGDVTKPRRRVRFSKNAFGELRRIHETVYATVGQVGKSIQMNVSSGNAGRRVAGTAPIARSWR